MTTKFDIGQKVRCRRLDYVVNGITIDEKGIIKYTLVMKNDRGEWKCGCWVKEEEVEAR